MVLAPPSVSFRRVGVWAFLTVPLSFSAIFRVFVALLMAGHIFFMYTLARAMGRTFGFDLGTSVTAALFAFGLMVPLVWAVGIPELPEVWTRGFRARRWWKQGRCPQCGYSLREIAGASCPECGLPGAAAEPPAYRLGALPIRRFIAMALVAWLLGCAVGETWLLNDERAFRSEAGAAWSIGRPFGRPRTWPCAQFSLWSSIDGPCTAEDPETIQITPAPLERSARPR
jgi:hypothetical protein